MNWFLYDNGLRHERVKWSSSRNSIYQPIQLYLYTII